ncbi:acyl-CoA N-acyltransferase [Aspergillus heterothallicus]
MAPDQPQRFKLRLVTDDDFPALFSALWHSFENPYQGILRLFFPILDNDRATSLKNCTAGQLEEYHQQQPNVTWITILDTENSDRVAAAAKWYFYDENPFKENEQHEADWYPEGVGREFATIAAAQFEAPRETMARRRHAFLHIAFTHPAYRRQGLGKMIMEWGLRIADERGLESWLDATEFGAPLYKLFGFRPILVNRVKPVPERDLSADEEEEWEHYTKTLLPIDATVMWRPPKGIFVEGQTVVPSMAEREYMK